MPYISHAMARCSNEVMRKAGVGGTSVPPTATPSSRTTRSMPARHPQAHQYADQAVADQYHQKTTVRRMLFVHSLLQSQISQMINANSCQSLESASNKTVFSEYKIDQSTVYYSGPKHKIYSAKRTTADLGMSISVRVYNRSDQDPVSSLYLKIIRHLGRKHPYVVYSLDLFYDAEKVYIFQEYCTGGNLRQYLEKNGTTSESLAVAWAKHLHQALDFLGDQAIAHRDLVPEHLVVVPLGSAYNPYLKLTGFKKAVIYWNTNEHDVLYCPCLPAEQQPADGGASNYQPLEVYGNATTEQFDPVQADIWSYGANIFFMLTKKYPFSGGTPVEGIEEEIRRNVAALSAISEHGRAFLTALLRINANNRMPFDFVEKHPWLTGKPAPAPVALPSQSPPAASAPASQSAQPKPEQAALNDLVRELTASVSALSLRQPSRTTEGGGAADGQLSEEEGKELAAVIETLRVKVVHLVHNLKTLIPSLPDAKRNELLEDVAQLETYSQSITTEQFEKFSAMMLEIMAKIDKLLDEVKPSWAN